MEDTELQTSASISGRGQPLPNLRPRLVRVKQAAEHLNITVLQLRTMLYKGVLPHLQQGHGLVLIDQRDLDAYKERTRKAG